MSWKQRHGLSKREINHVKQCAFQLLRKDHRLIAALPFLLCLVFGIFCGTCLVHFFGILLPVPANLLFKSIISFAIVIGCAICGGVCGLLILNHYLKQYIDVAVEIVRGNLSGNESRRPA